MTWAILTSNLWMSFHATQENMDLSLPEVRTDALAMIAHVYRCGREWAKQKGAAEQAALDAADEQRFQAAVEKREQKILKRKLKEQMEKEKETQVCVCVCLIELAQSHPSRLRRVAAQAAGM